MIKKFINKQSVLNVLLFAVYSLLLVFVIEWFSRGSIEAAYSFFRHFFKIFLYNTLIVSVTLSPCFLFKRRLFAFSLVSLVWIVLGIANNFLIKFRETPLTFADLGMMKNAIELSDQYLSKGAMILIASLFIIIFGLLIFIFIKSKKVKFEKFPTKKDETDTELCIELSDKLKAKEIHLIGALGGRIDHTIANINLLYYIRKRGITPKIISKKYI